MIPILITHCLISTRAKHMRMLWQIIILILTISSLAFHSRALGILFSEELIGILGETGFSNSPQNLRPQDKNYSKCGREVGKLVGRRDLKCSGQVLDTCCHTDKCPPTQSQVLKKSCEVLGILLGKRWEMKLSLLSL